MGFCEIGLLKAINSILAKSARTSVVNAYFSMDPKGVKWIGSWACNADLQLNIIYFFFLSICLFMSSLFLSFSLALSYALTHSKGAALSVATGCHSMVRG